MNSSENESQCFYCSTCNQTFKQMKHLAIHSAGLLHRECALLMQHQRKPYVYQDLDDQLKMAPSLDVDKWCSKPVSESCQGLSSAAALQLQRINSFLHTVFCVIHAPFAMFPAIESDNITSFIDSKKDSLSILSYDHQFQNTSRKSLSYYSENSVADPDRFDSTMYENSDKYCLSASTVERNNSSLKFNFISPLKDFISTDPLKFDQDNMAKLDQNVLDDNLEFLALSPEEVEASMAMDGQLPSKPEERIFRPYYCYLCGTLNVEGCDAHNASLRHCKLLLLVQLEMGISNFERLFGEVAFNIHIEGIESPPPSSYDNYLKRIYRSGVLNNLKCKACDDAKFDSMKTWYEHSLNPLHFKNMYILLGHLGKEKFLATYGTLSLQRDACLSKCSASSVMLKSLVFEQSMAKSVEVGHVSPDDDRPLVKFQIIDHNSSDPMSSSTENVFR